MSTKSKDWAMFATIVIYALLVVFTDLGQFALGNGLIVWALILIWADRIGVPWVRRRRARK